MRPSQLETADLYDDRLTAGLQAMRLLVDHTARRIFARHLANGAGLRRAEILGPAAPQSSDADLRAITAFNFRKGLLDYLLHTGRLAAAGDEEIRITPGLVVTPADEQQARSLTAADPRFAAIAELLGAFEEHAQKLLQGVDGTKVLSEKFGFIAMQSVWERQTLNMPQRTVERTLCARALLDRMRQPSKVTVLECGAGIGAVLRRALELPGFVEHLPSLGRYIYTDINPFLVEWSRDWFKRNAPAELSSRMEFRVLNLDALQAENAAGARSIDLVLLDDVAHDVVDLHGTLTGLRNLLREDGWLALTENFRQPPQDFLYVEIFAMTLHSYNKARVDPGRRATHGFMKLAEWRAALGAAGFSDLHVYPEPAQQSRWPVGAIVAAR